MGRKRRKEGAAGLRIRKAGSRKTKEGEENSQESFFVQSPEAKQGEQLFLQRDDES